MNKTVDTQKEFVKASEGKLQWTLLPWKELREVVEVLQAGAKKYSVDNWKKCDDLNEFRNALLRHVTSYMSGETIDPEDKKSHLAHAICNCLFLMYFDNQEKF